MKFQVHLILLGAYLKPFHATGRFLYPLKTSGNLWFSDIFKGYRKWPVARHGIRTISYLGETSKLYGLFLRTSLYYVLYVLYLKIIFHLQQVRSFKTAKRTRRNEWIYTQSQCFNRGSGIERTNICAQNLQPRRQLKHMCIRFHILLWIVGNKNSHKIHHTHQLKIFIFFEFQFKIIFWN